MIYHLQSISWTDIFFSDQILTAPSEILITQREKFKLHYSASMHALILKLEDRRNDKKMTCLSLGYLCVPKGDSYSALKIGNDCVCHPQVSRQC